MSGDTRAMRVRKDFTHRGTCEVTVSRLREHMHPRILSLIESQGGTALLTVLLVMFLVSAIALGAAAIARVELLVADRYRSSAEALSAADAGLESVVADLRTIPDWSPVLTGARQSALAQGAFQGSKPVPGAGTVFLCCGPGSVSERLATDTQLSPLPARRAIQWRPFLWTTVHALAPRDPPSRLFVVVWVGNDEGGAAVETNDTVVVRSEAVQANGLRRIVEAVVARQPRPRESGLYSEGSALEEARLMRVGILGWREVR
jgi:hypothetical protein